MVTLASRYIQWCIYNLIHCQHLCLRNKSKVLDDNSNLHILKWLAVKKFAHFEVNIFGI